MMRAVAKVINIEVTPTVAWVSAASCCCGVNTSVGVELLVAVCELTNLFPSLSTMIAWLNTILIVSVFLSNSLMYLPLSPPANEVLYVKCISKVLLLFPTSNPVDSFTVNSKSYGASGPVIETFISPGSSRTNVTSSEHDIVTTFGEFLKHIKFKASFNSDKDKHAKMKTSTYWLICLGAVHIGPCKFSQLSGCVELPPLHIQSTSTFQYSDHPSSLTLLPSSH